MQQAEQHESVPAQRIAAHHGISFLTIGVNLLQLHEVVWYNDGCKHFSACQPKGMCHVKLTVSIIPVTCDQGTTFHNGIFGHAMGAPFDYLGTQAPFQGVFEP